MFKCGRNNIINYAPKLDASRGFANFEIVEAEYTYNNVQIFFAVRHKRTSQTKPIKTSAMTKYPKLPKPFFLSISVQNAGYISGRIGQPAPNLAIRFEFKNLHILLWILDAQNIFEMTEIRNLYYRYGEQETKSLTVYVHRKELNCHRNVPYVWLTCPPI